MALSRRVLIIVGLLLFLAAIAITLSHNGSPAPQAATAIEYGLIV
jgi:hypothetical protein